MGARQSKRSVDITTVTKKGEGHQQNVVEGEGKVEKISELDTKVTNGTLHTDSIEYADKDDGLDESQSSKENIVENGMTTESGKLTPIIVTAKTEISDEQQAKSDDVPAAGDQEKLSPNNESSVSLITNDTTTNEDQQPLAKSKKKEKTKSKKWSIRNLSFSKKDKLKPNKDNTAINVTSNEEENATSPDVESPKSKEESPIAETEKSIEETKSIEPTKTPPPTPSVQTVEDVSNVKQDQKDVIANEINEIKNEIQPETIVVNVCDDIKKDMEASSEKISAVVEEIKEDKMPPLPTTNPPSSVTVFAESTKADTIAVNEMVSSTAKEIENSIEIDTTNKIEVNNESLPAPPSPPSPEIYSPPSPALAICPAKIETNENSDTNSVLTVEEVKIITTDGIDETFPEPISASSEPVANADSLPDLSTESLPSLPEANFDNLPEATLLPPPIIDHVTMNDVEKHETNEKEIDAITLKMNNINHDVPNDMVLTNGNTNGLASPTTNDISPPPEMNGETVSEKTETKCEIKTIEKVQETTPTPAEVEE